MTFDLTPASPSRPPADFYPRVGGDQFFYDLVHEFYLGVAGDPELRALYPEEHLSAAEERFRLFLMQYWGGPGTYSEQRGHPRLRMRHAPFPVTLDMRDRWLRHMRAALDKLQPEPDLEGWLWRYFEMAADSMRNVEG
ncbi:globin [Sporichthya sp.]|uniref:globin domain-containing protein n=1 Tax=Sporichthya sp. TaxID=65475 RepID=UPI0018301D06|nr:globin [Sporichthya sp.]MBA3743306.1 globin [Sporichthya sp.]